MDVFLLDPSGEDVDVMSPYTRGSKDPTYVYGLTPEAQANRMRLYDAMMAQGFSNCRDEWWHYNFGDAGWAVRIV
ncbi:MAG: M15 family metallopeptidase [Fimbriimonadaceae bacterium]